MNLQDELDRRTKPGNLYVTQDENEIRCLACAHRCLIKPGNRGICQLRFNQEGKLYVPWGYVTSLQVDPVEKKPFYHCLAGTDALTFGMLGCNLQCDYCQNWLTSQALRESGSNRLTSYLRDLNLNQIIDYGIKYGAEVVASSYNEPLITSEWAHDIFARATQEGLKTVYISNGFATPEVLDYLEPVLDGFKVDLKTIQEDHYRDLGGRLQPVLDSIKYAHSLGLWVEIVTLLVPGFNDTRKELEQLAEFILSVSPEIPWHITAFHPDYKMQDRSRTSAVQIKTAVEIGYQKGLYYVYGGNLPGILGDLEHTWCHNCKELLIKRSGFSILDYRITAKGNCPECEQKIPGIWSENPASLVKPGVGFPRIV
jgi:pyruvate formate lyase activating enzyme